MAKKYLNFDLEKKFHIKKKTDVDGLLVTHYT